MTRDAVIVATARTPIGRAYKGAFNDTAAPTLAAHAIRAAVERARVDPAEVQDCLLGCSLPQGSQQSIGRMAALRAGLPVTTPGMTIDRQCSSGLMTIATAAKQIITDRMDMIVAGGVESISLVQTDALRIDPDPELVGMHPEITMPMSLVFRPARASAMRAAAAPSCAWVMVRASTAARGSAFFVARM